MEISLVEFTVITVIFILGGLGIGYKLGFRKGMSTMARIYDLVDPTDMP